MPVPSNPSFWSDVLPFYPSLLARYQAYRQAKLQFDIAFPDASCAERDRAIAQIAKHLGI
jgi:hypothetical protein